MAPKQAPKQIKRARPKASAAAGPEGDTVLINPSPNRPRGCKAAAPVIAPVIGAVIAGDDDEEQEYEEDSSTEIVVPIVQTPKRGLAGSPQGETKTKKLKVGPQPARVTWTVCWVHKDWQSDVLHEHARNGETNGVMNYYIRAGMWVAVNFMLEDRVNVIQMMFGLSKKDTQLLESGGGGGKMNKQESFRAKMGKHFKGYYNNVVGKLQANFECLLDMFLKSDETQFVLVSHIGVWEVRRKLEEARKAKLGISTRSNNTGQVNAPVVSIRSIQPKVAIIEPEIIMDIFLNDNFKLVSDVWYPVMDVVEEGFLENNEKWGTKMLKRTAVILSWYVTLYFSAAVDPTRYIGNGKENGAGGVIDAADKTNALSKGDTPFTGWPALKKPAKWQKKMGKVVDYGELKGSKVVEDLACEDLEIDVMEEMTRADSVTKFPDMPTGTPEVLNTMSLEEQGVYFLKAVKAKCAALNKFKQIVEDKLDSLEEVVKSQEIWMKESADMTQKTLKGRKVFGQVERFCMEAKKIFSEKVNFEREQRVEGKALPADWISSVETLGTFSAWVEFIHGEGMMKWSSLDELNESIGLGTRSNLSAANHSNPSDSNPSDSNPADVNPSLRTLECGSSGSSLDWNE